MRHERFESHPAMPDDPRDKVLNEQYLAREKRKKRLAEENPEFDLTAAVDDLVETKDIDDHDESENKKVA